MDTPSYTDNSHGGTGPSEPPRSTDFVFEENNTPRRKITLLIIFGAICAQMFLRESEYRDYAPGAAGQHLVDFSSGWLRFAGENLAELAHLLAHLISIKKFSLSVYEIMSIPVGMFFIPGQFVYGMWQRAITDVDLSVTGFAYCAVIGSCFMVFAESAFSERFRPTFLLGGAKRAFVLFYKPLAGIAVDVVSFYYTLKLDRFFETLAKIYPKIADIILVPGDAVSGVIAYMMRTPVSIAVTGSGAVTFGLLYMYGGISLPMECFINNSPYVSIIAVFIVVAVFTFVVKSGTGIDARIIYLLSCLLLSTFFYDSNIYCSGLSS